MYNNLIPLGLYKQWEVSLGTKGTLIQIPFVALVIKMTEGIFIAQFTRKFE